MPKTSEQKTAAYQPHQVELKELLPDRWLQANPSHRWEIADKRKAELAQFLRPMAQATSEIMSSVFGASHRLFKVRYNWLSSVASAQIGWKKISASGRKCIAAR